MMESKKFNFVCEKIAEEDRKFIESFHIRRVYHGGMVQVVYWAFDKEKEILYFYIKSCYTATVEIQCDNAVTRYKIKNMIYK